MFWEVQDEEMVIVLQRHSLPSNSFTSINNEMSERIYRDPVHNIIRLRTDTPEGELMMKLIDSAEFQRLRRIKQLGLGLFTYQGAEHSRFTHSLGAFHLMTRVLDRFG